MSVESSPRSRRRWHWRIGAALAVLLLVVANVQIWVERSIVDTSTFVEAALEVFVQEDVREAFATQIVDNVLRDRPIVRAAMGNTLISTLTGLFGDDRFLALLNPVATQLHQALTQGEPLSITIESRELQVIVVTLARTLAPDQLGNLSFEGRALTIELFSRADIPSFESEIALFRWVGRIAGIAGVLLAALPIFVLRDRWSIRLAGLTLMAVALLSLLLAPLAQNIVGQRVADAQASVVIGAIIERLVLDFVGQSMLILLAGVLFFTLSLLARLLRRRPAPEPA